MSDQQGAVIILPSVGFKKFMFFNRFAIEREEGFVQIHFGFVNKASVLLDSYSTTIAELDLLPIRPVFMDYLGRQGSLADEPAQWQPPATTGIEVANHIVMAHHGPTAETLLFCFSYWSALEAAKRWEGVRAEKGDAEPKIRAQGMALLRSSVRIQQHLIRLLFRANEPLLVNG